MYLPKRKGRICPYKDLSTNITAALFFNSPKLGKKAVAPHSSTLAWKIPWMEEPGRLQSIGSLRVRHDWATSLSLFTFLHWRRKWQPAPVFLPGETQGWGAWWAAIYGVTQSRTQLKRLSSKLGKNSNVHEQINKQIMAHLNTIQWFFKRNYFDIHNNINEFQNNYTEWKKPDQKKKKSTCCENPFTEYSRKCKLMYSNRKSMRGYVVGAGGVKGKDDKGAWGGCGEWWMCSLSWLWWLRNYGIKLFRWEWLGRKGYRVPGSRACA